MKSFFVFLTEEINNNIKEMLMKIEKYQKTFSDEVDIEYLYDDNPNIFF